jgi:hypothetical protein
MKLNQYLFGKGKMEYYKYVQAANQWCMGATQIHAHPGSDAMQHASKRILPSVLLVALLLTGCGKVDISWTRRRSPSGRHPSGGEARSPRQKAG